MCTYALLAFTQEQCFAQEWQADVIAAQQLSSLSICDLVELAAVSSQTAQGQLLSDVSELLGTPVTLAALTELASTCLEIANEASLAADASVLPSEGFLHELSDGASQLDVVRVLALQSIGLPSGASHLRQLLASKRKSTIRSDGGATTDIVQYADVSAQNWTVADLQVDSLHMHGHVMKPRMFGQKNHLIGGMELRQERAADASEKCKSRFWRLPSGCQFEGSVAVGSGSGGTTAPFGRDPAFNTKSSLFSADAARNEAEYFNVSQGSAELSASGFPAAFFPRSSARQKPAFTVVLPVRPLLHALCVRFMHIYTASSCSLGPH